MVVAIEQNVLYRKGASDQPGPSWMNDEQYWDQESVNFWRHLTNGTQPLS